MNIESSLSREWLETNGRGGYASSTIIDCHTRKYHGLLVSNLSDPPGRFVLLSKVEDSLTCGGREYALTTHRYPGVYHPLGHEHQVSFHVGDCPCFTFRIGDLTLCKRVMMIRGEDRVMIRYSCEGGEDGEGGGILRIRPLIAYRGIHELGRENPCLRKETYPFRNGFMIRPYDGMPELFVQTGGRSRFHREDLWYRRFEYGVEEERGFAGCEDLFQPGVIEMPFLKGADVFLSAALGKCRESLRVLWERETLRRKKQAEKDDLCARDITGGIDKGKTAELIRGGRAFLIRDHRKKPAVVAGYHWFYEWGRDTLIALPGLTFCSGRPEEGIALLKKYAALEKNGRMPNVLSEDGTSGAYNTVDGALWFFWAVQQMLKYTGDLKTFRRDLWPVMKRILDHYMKGADDGIYLGDNGLLHAGTAETALTWMDAKVGGRPVTPRSGYAVEINALWYNALSFAETVAERLGGEKTDLRRYIDRMRESFSRTFWIEEDQYLGDVYREGGLDRSVRPNQIFAVSLPFSPLEPSQWRGIVERVRRELLTPCGLRTLSPADPAYRGRYDGNAAARDGAYHQGTVWPWLIGPFGEAWLKTASDGAAVRAFLLEYVKNLLESHIMDAGVGFVSEVFDGDAPHRPGGCIAQAWSTAEIIRLMRLLGDDPSRS